MENEQVELVAKPESHVPEIEIVNGVPYALLPKGTNVQDLPEYLDKPRHLKQSITLLDQGSFIAYVDTYDDGDGAVFFDTDNLKFEAILDYHKLKSADNCKHRAVYKLKTSRVFNDWRKVNGQGMSQDDWLDFLEDRDVDFVTPSPADIITVIRDFRAKKVSAFKSVKTLETGDVDLQFTTDTQSTGKVVVPRDILLSLPIFENLDPVEIRGRFRYSVRDGRLTMKIILPRIEDIIEAAAKEVATVVKTGLGAPLYFGTPR